MRVRPSFHVPENRRLSGRTGSGKASGNAAVDFDALKQAILGEAQTQIETFSKALLAGLADKIEALRPASDLSDC